MTVGAEVTVEVVIEVSRGAPAPKTSTSRQGDGIARVQGFVLFVKNAKAGQNVKVKV